MQTSPSILYHYTTAHGLRCIVESKSIWASDFRFLNDASEFQHGRSIFEKIFREMHQTLPSAAAKRIDDGLGEMADPQFHVLVRFVLVQIFSLNGEDIMEERVTRSE